MEIIENFRNVFSHFPGIRPRNFMKALKFYEKVFIYDSLNGMLIMISLGSLMNGAFDLLPNRMIISSSSLLATVEPIKYTLIV